MARRSSTARKSRRGSAPRSRARWRRSSRATGRAPGLATILVGDDPGLGDLRRQQAQGVRRGRDRRLPPPPRPPTSTQAEVAAVIEECNRDPAVSGILLQLPVPAGLDGAALTATIAPEKDVDGLTPISAGRLVAGHPRAAAVHAARRDRAARQLWGRARGSRGGRRRPLEPRRQAASRCCCCSATRR